MTCPACTEAQASRWCGAYRSDCLECTARALSHSPAFYESAQAKVMQPDYIAALRAVWADDWQAGHMRVKHWAELRSELPA